MAAAQTTELILWFDRLPGSQLIKTRFYSPRLGAVAAMECQRREHFSWTAAVQALVVFLLRWAAHGRRASGDEPVIEGGRPSIASSILDLLYKHHDIFWPEEVFGKDEGGEPLFPRLILRLDDERVRLNPDELPPDAIRVFISREPIESPEQLDELAEDVQRQWQVRTARRQNTRGRSGRGATAPTVRHLTGPLTVDQKRLYRRLRRAIRWHIIDSDRRLAWEIQRKLMPASAPVLPGFDIHGELHPAWLVGGTFYDLHHLADGSLALVLGDAAGHGALSAYVSAVACASLRALAGQSSELPAILHLANQVVLGLNQAEFYVTLFYGRLDVESRTLTWVGAGLQGYLMAASGRVRTLNSSAPPLGLEEKPKYLNAPAVTLRPGDTVLLMSNALQDALSPRGEAFGLKRVLAVVRKNRERPARQICAALHRAVQEFAPDLGRFSADAPQTDDVTMILVKVES